MASDSVRPLALSPRPLARSAVIVCETRSYWTPELQRQFFQSEIAVRPCQKWSELSARGKDFPRVVEVVDLEDRPGECLTSLTQRQGRRQSVPLIVIASPAWAALEYILREAGVQAVFPDLPTGAELARCCRRWLQA